MERLSEVEIRCDFGHGRNWDLYIQRPMLGIFCDQYCSILLPFLRTAPPSESAKTDKSMYFLSMFTYSHKHVDDEKSSRFLGLVCWILRSMLLLDHFMDR